MKKIYIFGTGGFAKEVYFLIHEINKEKATFDVSGFIDIHPSVQQMEIAADKFNGFDEQSFFNNTISDDVCFAIGIDNPN